MKIIVSLRMQQIGKSLGNFSLYLLFGSMFIFGIWSSYQFHLSFEGIMGPTKLNKEQITFFFGGISLGLPLSFFIFKLSKYIQIELKQKVQE